ncbi:MAG: hypothetical protein K2G64_05465, partial [Muribaculaceae bacterium]|nr:hypothetical protein [Muribaculaceae bacterium]
MSATTPISVSEQNPVVSENFNSMWDATTSEALMTLPDGWAIDRNLDAPRTIGAWSNATNEVMYAGGASLASNAKNG